MRCFLNVSRAVLKKPTPNRTRTSTRFFSANAQNVEVAKDASDPKPKGAESIPLSSCPENTVLTGLNYLKGQTPVLALKDDEYPTWLWDLLKPKVFPDDGPGGKGEKMRLRAANRQRIKEQNFLKTQ